jgi:DNA-directed RNA polymerase specialized sigma24 family protein
MLDEVMLVQGLKRRETRAFKQLMTHYSDDLLLFAYALTGSGDRASEIVGQVLLKTFDQAATSDIPLPLKSYLKEQVRRACEGSQ